AVAHSASRTSFLTEYAHARGLIYHKDSALPTSGVPLLRRGDERRCHHRLDGLIGGQSGRISHYTYTEITTDSDGGTQRTDYHFTLVSFQLPPALAQRYSGVYLRPKTLTFGALQDKLAHDRSVTLESAAFEKKYSLRVVDSQDDIALYELFSPPFIEHLSQ